MNSPLDAYADLIGKTVRIENADNDMLNVVDVATGTRYHIESTGKLLVFASEEPRDESGYPGLQGLEAIARRREQVEADREARRGDFS